ISSLNPGRSEWRSAHRLSSAGPDRDGAQARDARRFRSLADRNGRCRIKFWICRLRGDESKRTTAYRLRLHSLRQRMARAKAYLQRERHAISPQAAKTPDSPPTGDLNRLRAQRFVETNRS